MLPVSLSEFGVNLSCAGAVTKPCSLNKYVSVHHIWRRGWDLHVRKYTLIISGHHCT